MDDGNNREKVTFTLIELFTTIEANLLNTIWLIYRCTVEVWLDSIAKLNDSFVKLPKINNDSSRFVFKCIP